MTKTLIVDGGYLITSLSKSKKNDRHNKELFVPIQFLNRITLIKKRHYKIEKTIVIFDGIGCGLLKFNRYKTYKLNRLQNMLIHTKDITDFDEENYEDYYFYQNFKNTIINTSELCQKFGYIVYSQDYIEADDIISLYIKNKKEEEHVIVYTGDNDYLQFVENNVSLILQHKFSETITKQNFKEIIGFPQENYRIIKSIIGDKSDNIKNVYGIGLNTLLKHLPKLKEEIFDNLETFLNYLNTEQDSKTKTEILNNFDLIRKNYEILSYHELTIFNKDEILSILNQTQQKENIENIMNYITQKYFKYIEENNMQEIKNLYIWN